MFDTRPRIFQAGQGGRSISWLLAWILVFSTTVSCLAWADVDARWGPAKRIVDLGVPVRSVNWVRLHVATDGQDQPCLLATMGQDAKSLFVLKIDPITGKSSQFVTAVPRANFPTATLMSRSGLLYIGAAYAGHLLCFDPRTNDLRDLGAIHSGAASFPCRMDEDSQGRIWIGSYPAADLTCYDPASREFTHFGRMDSVDMYNYAWVNTDDTIACLIRMTRPHVVVLDPKTGARTTVGPITTKGKESLDMRRGVDRRLYIVSSIGNYRIDAGVAHPVDTVPPAPAEPRLKDGSTARFVDAKDQIYRKLVVRGKGGAARTLSLSYDASGNNVFCLHAGPNGCIYGSSYLPEHLFRYTPNSGQLVDLGQCSVSSGEAYSMANLAGRIYISSYPGAHLSVYDPKQPYRFGTDPKANPRDLGRIDDISYRPRATLAGPLGRVWLASIPDYGRWGGPLSWFDPATGKKKAYHQIVGDASCYVLAHLRTTHLLAIGTNIAGGSGTRPKVTQAKLVLWDYQAEKIAWEGTLQQPVAAFNSLTAGPDGKLYGSVRTRGVKGLLFAFDPATRKFTATCALPSGQPLDLGLCGGPGARMIGFSSTCIYRLDPEPLKTEVLARPPGGIQVAGPVVGRRVYFARGSHVFAAEF